MCEITFKPVALKTLLRMPRKQAHLIRTKIEALKKNPYALNNNVKKLQNIEGYRLQVGHWLIIYHIDNNILKILFIKITVRGDIYQ